MSETKFQVGDKVEAFGCEGVVAHISAHDFAVDVRFTDMHSDVFLHDGKAYRWHKEPSLKLIERPKKKVTKTMYQAICRYSETVGIYVPDQLYQNESHAKSDLGSVFIALGPAITFEVEE